MRTSAAVAVTAVLLGLAPVLSRPAAGAMTAEERLRVLEEQLKAAQDEIKQLRREVQDQKERAGAAAPAPGAPAPGAPPAPPTETAKAPSKLIELPKWLDKLTFFGDLRFRHEGFYNQPREDGEVVHARNRERIRARVGLTFKYSDEIAGTVRIATGNPDDPISTNVTLGDSFTRKDIALDWGFVQLTPGQSFGWRPGVFQLQAGKFPLGHFRVGELVFDDDLAPEGFQERIALLPRPIGYLQQVNMHLLQWTFDEIARAQDGWMIGGQIAPKLKIGSAEFEAGLGQYWWLNADLIAQELNSNDALANTNLVVVDADGDVVEYASAFNQTNLTMQLAVPDTLFGQLLRVSLDWVYNWEAATDQDYGVQGAVRLGLPKKRGDWAVSLIYQYLQQEAAISAFTWSDFGFGGTNGQGPIVAIDYQLLDPLTLTARTYFINYIERPAGSSNDTLIRLQLDALLRW